MILNGPEFLTQLVIEKVEKVYNARYVFETPLVTNGTFRDEPSLIFYSDVAHPTGSHWFALSKQRGEYIISDAKDSIDLDITGIQADDGTVVYSHCRHDYRASPDGSVWIDGGRDYTRCSDADRLVTLRVVADRLELVD